MDALASNIQCVELETASSSSKVLLAPELCRLILSVDSHNAQLALQLIANNGGLASLSIQCLLTGCEHLLTCLCTLKHLSVLRLYAQIIGAPAGIAGISALCPHLNALQIEDYDSPFDTLKLIWAGKDMVAAVAECVRRAHKLRMLRMPQMLTDTILSALAESNNGGPHLNELNMPLSVQDIDTIRRTIAALANIERIRGLHCRFAKRPKQMQQLVLACMTQLKFLTVPGTFLRVVAKLHVI
jgi:hypothetical protein